MPVTRRMQAVMKAHQPLRDFLAHSAWSTQTQNPQVSDFTFGNPQEMPIPGFTEALQARISPQNKDWYAYKLSEPETCAYLAESLRQWRGVAFEPEDVAVTNGAFGAIATAFAVFLEPGDEAIFSLPPWFLYEAMLLQVGATPVKVRVRQEDFDLDLDAIEAAITPRTKMVIVNSPCNPTGRVYSAATLQRLSGLLRQASEVHGHPIYLLSDEPYSRLVFDGAPFISPTDHYPYSMISYSYGKVLLTPGQRLGFLAMPPHNPEREARRDQIATAQVAGGWLFANALLQHAVADLDKLSIDVARLQEKRDLMVSGLRAAGYDVHSPEGTFYLLPKSPISDDMAFAEALAAKNVLVLPGTVCEIPGYFRIALTASQAALEASLPAFEAARREVLSR